MKIDNAMVDEFILSELPATYSALCAGSLRLGDDLDRPIDRRLQALRKKGRITFTREGRLTIWRAADTSDD